MMNKNDDFILKFVHRESIKNIMRSSKEYVNWLKKFTEENPSFSDDYYEIVSGEYSDTDKINMKNLSLLFEVIDEYAKKNYMSTRKNEYSESYNFRSDDISYNIGFFRGQGSSFFCQRIDDIETKDFIDFDDIIKGSYTNDFEKNKNKVEKMKNNVMELYQSGVPLEIIKSEFENTIKNITSEKQNTLKKKLY